MSADSPHEALPAGKVPVDLLRSLLSDLPQHPGVLLGPGVGRDVAVIGLDGGMALVLKSDPITFATDSIGWYAINVNANDLATVGAEPKWFLATILLPEGQATEECVRGIMSGLQAAADSLGIAVVGGHTEITGAVERPVVAGMLAGTVARDDLILPDGLRPGDAILLTGGLAIEATSIVAREFPERLRAGGISGEEITAAANYLYEPGISVVRSSQIVRNAVRPHAMHDPTEGGIATAVAEMAEAAQLCIEIDMDTLHGAVAPLSRRVCAAVGVDPLGAVSSGALLAGVPESSADAAVRSLRAAGIDAWRIGTAVTGHGVSTVCGTPWPEFPTDEIARLF